MTLLKRKLRKERVKMQLREFISRAMAIIILFSMITTSTVAAAPTASTTRLPIAGASEAMANMILENQRPSGLVAGASAVLAESLDSANQNVEAQEEETEKKETEKKEQEEKKQEEKNQTQAFPQFAGDVYLLAQIITCEADETSEADMTYTGSVVINRARTNYKDFRNVNSIYAVLYQGGQYAQATKDKIASGIKPTEAAMRIAQGLIDGTIECLPEQYLFQTSYTLNLENYINVTNVSLPGAKQYYAVPNDF